MAGSIHKEISKLIQKMSFKKKEYQKDSNTHSFILALKYFFSNILSVYKKRIITMSLPNIYPMEEQNGN